MIVETKLPGRRTPSERHPVHLPVSSYPLRGLITHFVEVEVAADQGRQDQLGLLRLLTEQALTAIPGRLSVAPQEPVGTASAEDASCTALPAFGDGHAVVDDQQINSLDQVLTLRLKNSVLPLSVLVGA